MRGPCQHSTNTHTNKQVDKTHNKPLKTSTCAQLRPRTYRRLPRRPRYLTRWAYFTDFHWDVIAGVGDPSSELCSLGPPRVTTEKASSPLRLRWTKNTKPTAVSGVCCVSGGLLPPATTELDRAGHKLRKLTSLVWPEGTAWWVDMRSPSECFQIFGDVG